ncbi:hypothetical protein [Streptomyces sp. NPDC058294]|uniref:hypothetical protein n=1 Tax=Streptomyces sp. NPDC058294 TaxID=3346430 RepID=UPI0036E6BF58
MNKRGTVRTLRIAMWVLIMVSVPLYLVWLARVGYLAGHRLPEGDITRWAPAVLLPPAAVLFCVMAGRLWWMSVVDRTASPLRERWTVASLVFIAVASVFCGVVAVDDRDVSAGLLGAVVTGLGMAGLFFIPAARFRRMPDVVGRHSADPGGPAA